MLKIIKKFEKMIIFAIVLMMALILLLSTVELGWILFKDIISPPLFVLNIEELLELFGLVMLVLIGIELLETIVKTYQSPSTDHAQIVIAVAITAIARKVIIMDVKDLSGPILLGIAAIVMALSVGYYLIKKSPPKGADGHEAPHGSVEV